MQIGIDANFLIRDRRGMGRFVRNLIIWLCKLKPDYAFTLLYHAWGDKPEDFKSFFRECNFNFLPAEERYRDNFDIFWFPWGRVDFLPNCRKLVNVYDVVPFVFQNSSFKTDQKRLKSAAECADRIITTSFFSKKEIIKFLSIGQEKIGVVYPGIDKVFHPEKLNLEEKQNLQEFFSINEGFWLFVGSHDKRKNLENLIMAFKIYKDRTRSGKKLVMVGDIPPKSRWYAKILQRLDLYDLIGKLQLGGEVVWAGQLSDEELNKLYNIACLLVFPSLCEGFGFPVVEAMASRLPVICSDRTSMPEVAGNAALYFNPENPAEIADLARILDEDSILREDLKNMGELQAKKFTFESCARQYIEVFEELIV